MTDPGYRGIQEVEYGASGQVLTCWTDLNGVQTDPTAGATVRVFCPGQDDSSPQVASTAATEDPTTHQLSYTLDASNTGIWVARDGYRAKWNWVSGGVARSTTTTFEVVHQPLVYNCPVTQEDVLKAYQPLAEALTQEGETATTVAQKYINMAWQDVLAWVRSKGKRPSLTTGKEGFYLPTYYRALVLLMRAHRESGNDTWDAALQDALKDYETAQKECVLMYREADSALAVKDNNWEQPRFRAGPPLVTGQFYLQGRRTYGSGR
jgi:hypothetical protein